MSETWTGAESIEGGKASAEERGQGSPVAEVEGRLLAAQDRGARLERVTASLAQALSPRDMGRVTLQTVVEALGAQVGSLSLLTRDESAIETAAVVGMDPRLVEAFNVVPTTTRIPAADALRTGRPVVIESAEEHAVRYPEAASRSSQGGGTRVSLPLLARGRALGALSFAFAEWRPLSEDERAFMATVADRCAQALERARLYQAEREAREQAEIARAEAERSAAHTRRLQAVTSRLSRALLPGQVAEVIIGEGAKALAAQSGAVWMLDGAHTRLELLGAEGYPEEALAAVRALPLVRDIPIADAVLRAEPVWIESQADYARRYPASEARTRHMREAGRFAALSVACLPLQFEGRILGALALAYTRERKFDAFEREFVMALAHQCAQALERASLFEREKEARAQAEAAHRRTAFLLEAGDLLSSSLDLGETMTRLTRLAVPRIADWCVVDLSAEVPAGVMQLAVAHVDPKKVELAREIRRRYPPDLTAQRGSGAVIRTGKPELYESFGDDLLTAVSRDQEHLRLLREIGIRSVMVAPMPSRGRTFGALTFASAESGRRFGPADLEMAVLLGRRAGVAVENARLYDDEQRARADAQAASRARQEVMAVVSHDLRNPLSSIVLNAASLLTLEIDDRRSSRIRKQLEAIQRAGARMGRLIDDLVDYATLQAGRLAIATRPCPPREIVDEALETFEGAAAEREVRLERAVAGDLPAIDCDRERVVQALGNLVSNAIKVTDAGGVVEVGAEAPSDREVGFFVRDGGPGIAAEDLPHIFERYWRSEKASYRGTGLGLSIAKGIVEAHGGRIWADSTVGAGSRFCFALPRA